VTKTQWCCGGNEIPGAQLLVSLTLSTLKEARTMRRLITFVPALAAMLALSALLAPRLIAQEATPSPGPIAVVELAPGVTAEVFAGVPSARAPGQTLYVARFVFQPGSEIFPHTHPGTVVLAVESGTFGWTLVQGTAHVIRGAAAGATGPAEDVTTPGTEVILNPGDAIYYEDVVHTARNAGDEPVVILGSLLFETGQPLLMPMEMGTPPAGTPAS
jgi:quercetin dioxygenase-like cupin family protein